MRKVRCKQQGSPFVKWASIDHFTLCFVVVVVVVVIVVLVVYFQLLTLLVRLAARYVRAGDKSNTVGVLRSRNVYQDMGRFHEPVLLTIQYLASAEAREIKSKLMVER